MKKGKDNFIIPSIILLVLFLFEISKQSKEKIDESAWFVLESILVITHLKNNYFDLGLSANNRFDFKLQVWLCRMRILCKIATKFFEFPLIKIVPMYSKNDE
jgi:hypothetical protein